MMYVVLDLNCADGTSTIYLKISQKQYDFLHEIEHLFKLVHGNKYGPTMELTQIDEIYELGEGGIE